MTEKTPLPIVNTFQPYLGCDPEFFFKSDDGVIGAEKVFKKEGLLNTTPSVNDRCVLEGTKSQFVIDGVQAELNPRPNTCRANLANEISACFKTLDAELKKQKTNISVDFSRSVVISEEKLAELDKENQKLGCKPSNSAYRGAGVKLSEVDPLKHRQRSAGGHIHIGIKNQPRLEKAVKKHPTKVIKMLDIICGNTCVLIDRDEGNKERRKLYGRAGEYRLPAHGIEYRTLSNFWLESYHLMSLAFGMARLAVELISDEKNSAKYYKAFSKAVNMKDIERAINDNDFDLAYQNFKKIEPLLAEVTAMSSEHHPVNKNNLPQFHYFVSKVKTNGLKHFFKDDAMKHWTTLPEAHKDGFYYFLNTVIKPEMVKEKNVG